MNIYRLNSWVFVVVGTKSVFLLSHSLTDLKDLKVNLNLILFSTYKYSLQITHLAVNYITKLFTEDIRSNNTKIIAFNMSNRKIEVLMDM